MVDGLLWVLRPWLVGRVDFHQLRDGTYDLADIYMMNEALDVWNENEYRMSVGSKNG